MHIISKTILLAASTLMITTANATGWPIFTAPDTDYLLKHHLIDTEGCLKGQGKLASHVTIPVSEFCRANWCPAAWMWEANSDNLCHDLKNGFKLQHYAVTRHRGQDSSTAYSEVRAFYADTTSAINSIQFNFITPKEHWDCYEFNSADGNYISCANDI